MSADTEPNGSVDPSAEIEGFHDRLRRANRASHEGRWDDVVEILSGAKSEALKRKADLARKGEIDG